jgi:hypothetical protein
MVRVVLDYMVIYFMIPRKLVCDTVSFILDYHRIGLGWIVLYCPPSMFLVLLE